MKRKRFMVVGLGVLGQSVAQSLVEDGGEVIAVDKSPVLVDQIKDVVKLAVQTDAADRKALEQLGVTDLDAAIVCIGEEFESAVLATANLLELGVKHVAARANSKMAASILKRLGAHDVFFVERAMGKIIAHKLNQPAVSNEMEIADGYCIVQWQAPPQMVGKKVSELALPKHFRTQIIAIRNSDQQRVMKTPTADTIIENSDLLLLSGHEKDLAKLFDEWKTH